MKLITGLGRFWYDFVVGDSIALAVGGAGVIAIGALLVWLGAGSMAQILLPLVVAATLAVSLRWPH